MPTMQEIVDEVDRRSVGTEFGRLQELRRQLNGSGFGSVPFASANSHDYAFHRGGYKEVQFNIGLEAPVTDTNGDLRYGIAVSFQPSQSLPDVRVMQPKARLFNDYLRQNPDEFGDLWMWHHSPDGRSDITPPRPIADGEMTPRYFNFLGLATTFHAPDYDRMIATFNRVLPLYLYSEGGPSVVSAPSKVAIAFKPGFAVGVTCTTATITAKSTPVNLRHKLIQQALYDLLIAQHGAEHVGGEQPSDGGGLIDMVVETPTKRILFEVKTASTARGCVREALGQVIDYALWPGSRTVDEIVIVGEEEATPTEEDYVSLLAKSLPIPISYRSVKVPS
jgi:hypothetical protein